MNIRQVEDFFKDKNDTPCQLTERLIKAGYQQTSGEYIDLAKKRGLTVDYKKPSLHSIGILSKNTVLP